MKINKLILILMIGSINITNTTIPEMSWPLLQPIGLIGIITGSYKMGKAICAERLRNKLSEYIISLKKCDTQTLWDWHSTQKEAINMNEFGQGFLLFGFGFVCYALHQIALYDDMYMYLKKINSKLSNNQKEA